MVPTVGDVGRDVELLDERIDDTREVVSVALDNQRNRYGANNGCVNVIMIQTHLMGKGLATFV